MNVRPTPDPRPAAAAAVGAVRPEQGADPRSAPSARSGAAASADTDRVELSAGAKAEAQQARSGHGLSPEVESARVALRAQPSLSPERLHELKERVRTGHYDQPEVVARVATSAVRDLGA